MNIQTLRAVAAAFAVAAVMGLAATGPAGAQSVMKQCGDEWKAAKAAGTTNGQTWQEFLKSCRTQHASAPAAAPAAAAPAARRPPSDGAGRRACSRGARAGPDAGRSAEARPRGRADEADGQADRRRPVQPPKPRPRRAVPATRWCGSTPSRTSTTTPAPAATARPSRAPTCAKPTPQRRATAPRRAGSARRPHSNSKRGRLLSAEPLPQLAGEGGRRPDGVWPAASTRVGLRDRHREAFV